jgi:hypothetical protein
MRGPDNVKMLLDFYLLCSILAAVNIKVRGFWDMKSVLFWSDVIVGTESTASSAEYRDCRFLRNVYMRVQDYTALHSRRPYLNPPLSAVKHQCWPVLAGTRAQSGDRCDSGTLHSRHALRGSLPLLPLPLDVPNFAVRCLHVPINASAPSSERWNFGREWSGNFAEMTLFYAI